MGACEPGRSAEDAMSEDPSYLFYLSSLFNQRLIQKSDMGVGGRQKYRTKLILSTDDGC